MLAVICTLAMYAAIFEYFSRTLTDYMPTYYQACKGASPRQSGIDSLALTMSLGPASIVTGVSVTKTGKYRIQAYLGWIILVAGAGALTTISENTILAHSIGLPSLISIGAGMIYSVGYCEPYNYMLLERSSN